MAQLWQQHGDLLSLANEPERLLCADDALTQQLLDECNDGLVKLARKI